MLRHPDLCDLCTLTRLTGQYDSAFRPCSNCFHRPEDSAFRCGLSIKLSKAVPFVLVCLALPAKALPLPCVSAVFMSKTLPFLCGHPGRRLQGVLASPAFKPNDAAGGTTMFAEGGQSWLVYPMHSDRAIMVHACTQLSAIVAAL